MKLTVYIDSMKNHVLTLNLFLQHKSVLSWVLYLCFVFGRARKPRIVCCYFWHRDSRHLFVSDLDLRSGRLSPEAEVWIPGTGETSQLLQDLGANLKNRYVVKKDLWGVKKFRKRTKLAVKPGFFCLYLCYMTKPFFSKQYLQIYNQSIYLSVN